MEKNDIKRTIYIDDTKNLFHMRALTIEKRKIVLDCLSKLSGRANAAEAIGVSYKTLDKWIRKYKDFHDQVVAVEEEAKMKGRSYAISIIFKNMEKNWNCARWWLERNYPQEFGNKERIDMDITSKNITFQFSQLQNFTEGTNLLGDKVEDSLIEAPDDDKLIEEGENNKETWTQQ